MISYHNTITDETASRLPKAWKFIATITPEIAARFPAAVRFVGMTILGLNENNMALYGWEKIVTPDPEPEPPVIPAELIAKEQAFAAKLAQLATAFQIDLLALPDINIGTMLQAAQQAGASETEIANASAILMALFNDVVVENGGTSADAWAGLKSRLPGHLQEV